MSYTPVTFPEFGGLDLKSDPQDVGPGRAVSGLNFDLDRAQRVRSRDGSTRLGSSTTSGSTPQWQIPFNVGGTRFLLTVSGTGATTYLDKFTTAGVRTAVGNWASAGYFTDYVRIGTPTAERVYLSTAAVSGGFAITAGVRSYDGTTLSATLGAPQYLGLLPTSNRLVQANFVAAVDSPTGANGSPSTVFFSDAGAPETFGANNYVHLTPGDGEQIVAVESWREMLFVFKQSTLFIFYGTSTSGTGTPIFNYRTVSLPTGIELPSATKRPVTVGTDGVYFFAGNAIYRTTGGDPQVMSDPVESIFRRTTDATLNYGGSEISLSWADERLYIRYLPASGSEPQLLVYDARIGEWMLWQFGSVSASTARISSNVVSWQGRPFYLKSAGHIMYVDPAATLDGSTDFFSHWQSGLYDLGSPEVKTIRETVVWGSGSPTLSVFTDHATTDANAAAVTLGVSPLVEEELQRTSRRGVLFSHKLSSTSLPWSVNRVTHHVRETRMAGVR